MDELLKADESDETPTFKDQLLDEWIKENPAFDNDKEKFEDFLVREIRVMDANHAIQLLEKDKEINSLQGQILELVKTNAILRGEDKNFL